MTPETALIVGVPVGGLLLTVWAIHKRVGKKARPDAFQRAVSRMLIRADAPTSGLHFLRKP
jgi:hypothetical protein